MPVLSGECDLETHPRKLLISFDSFGGVPKEPPSTAKNAKMKAYEIIRAKAAIFLSLILLVFA